MLVYRTAVNYRLLRRKTPRNDIGGRSFCDYCGKKLSWLENIPIVSWVVQQGKTRCCGKKLDWSYPLVEIGTGVLFVVTNYKLLIANNFEIYNFQSLIFLLISLVIITFLVFEAVFDLKYMILPDFGIIILTVCSVVLILINRENIINYLLAAGGAAGFLGLIHLLTKGKGMGLGDVKYAVFMGLLLGVGKVIVAFYIAFIVGAVVAVGLMMAGRVGRKSMIAFGPFLILGTMVAWWWGETIIKLLMSNY